MRDLKRQNDNNERTKIVSGCFPTSLLESTKRGGGFNQGQTSLSADGDVRWVRLYFIDWIDNNGIAFQQSYKNEVAHFWD